MIDSVSLPGHVSAPIPRRKTWLIWLNLGLLATLGTGLTVLLFPQWLHNPDLSHGLLMPVVCLLLINEARTGGPARYLRAGPVSRLMIGLALLFGLLGLAVSGLYAAALEWSHPVAGFALAGAFTFFLLATLIAFADERVRLIPLNWSAFLAATLWWLSAPIPPGTYSRLTLSLQLWVSENVLGALHFLGIAANRDGNIIELAHTAVGVEEACSGVRSLVSCVFAGLFFSGCLVQRPWARALIVGLAGPLALGMNFFRSLALTLLANAGIDIGGKWHDLTGFAILALTAVILGALALLLQKGAKPPAPKDSRLETPPVENPRDTQPLLATGLGLAVILAVFFLSHSEFRSPPRKPLPNLEAILPLAANGWNVRTTADLYRFKDTLQTDHFVERTYTRNTGNGLVQITVYIAYWAPGQANVSLVATHTPDACLPGAGWVPIPVAESQQRIVLPTRELPAGEHRLFKSNGYPQHVWFWHLYDGAPIRYLNPLSPRNLLQIAAQYGFRRAGDQMFVRFSSNRPWKTIRDEPLVTEIFTHLQPFGL